MTCLKFSNLWIPLCVSEDNGNSPFYSLSIKWKSHRNPTVVPWDSERLPWSVQHAISETITLEYIASTLQGELDVHSCHCT